jgi:hypothetical protein
MFSGKKIMMLAGGLVAAAVLGSSAAMAEVTFIGGTTPSVRPAGAPTITTYKMSAAQEKDFFRGVSKPYPASLLFVKNQGAWFTPFMHAGMTSGYDIRGWHKK